MMRGQIEEQKGNVDAAREIYTKAVFLCLSIVYSLFNSFIIAEESASICVSLATSLSVGRESRAYHQSSVGPGERTTQNPPVS